MKKLLIVLVAIIGFGISANAQCSFAVTDVRTSGYSGNYIISVWVQPTFTPTESRSYTIVVVPKNRTLVNVLTSQRLSVKMTYDAKGRYWSSYIDGNSDRSGQAIVKFECETNDKPQCTEYDFKVDDCWAN